MALSVKYNAIISVTFKVRIEKRVGEMTQLLKTRLETRNRRVEKISHKHVSSTNMSHGCGIVFHCDT